MQTQSYLSYVMENKQIDRISKIILKRHDVFTENVTIFFFSKQRKTKIVLEFEFDKFQKTIFWRLYKENIYNVTTSAFYFKQLYIFCNFILRNEYIYLKEYHIWYRHFTVLVKNSYILASLRVLCFTCLLYNKGIRVLKKK